VEDITSRKLAELELQKLARWIAWLHLLRFKNQDGKKIRFGEFLFLSVHDGPVSIELIYNGYNLQSFVSKILFLYQRTKIF
jgi:hypothetical protein